MPTGPLALCPEFSPPECRTAPISGREGYLTNYRNARKIDDTLCSLAPWAPYRSMLFHFAGRPLRGLRLQLGTDPDQRLDEWNAVRIGESPHSVVKLLHRCTSRPVRIAAYRFLDMSCPSIVTPRPCTELPKLLPTIVSGLRVRTPVTSNIRIRPAHPWQRSFTSFVP